MVSPCSGPRTRCRAFGRTVVGVTKFVGTTVRLLRDQQASHRGMAPCGLHCFWCPACVFRKRSAMGLGWHPRDRNPVYSDASALWLKLTSTKHLHQTQVHQRHASIGPAAVDGYLDEPHTPGPPTTFADGVLRYDHP